MVTKAKRFFSTCQHYCCGCCAGAGVAGSAAGAGAGVAGSAAGAGAGAASGAGGGVASCVVVVVGVGAVAGPPLKYIHPITMTRAAAASASSVFALLSMTKPFQCDVPSTMRPLKSDENVTISPIGRVSIVTCSRGSNCFE
jgi:hypothetical protein